MTNEQKLIEIVLKSELINTLLNRIPKLKLPNWYLGAGCISQTVWNYYHGFDLIHGIKDCDLVYFDPDTSYEAEDVFIQQGKRLFGDLPIEVEIRNQARVHLWYADHFGQSIRPFKSVEDGIRSWPTTSTTVGLNKTGEEINVFAPFGLDDLLAMTIRPNKVQTTKANYEQKIKRWCDTWPQLTVIPWDEEKV